MPIQKFPAQRLLDYQNCVNRIHDTDFGLYMLLFRLIREWYNNNGVRLDSLKERIKKLQKEFLKFENDQIKFIPEVKIPAVPAVYEEKLESKKWYEFWRKPLIIKVLVLPEVPEKIVAAEPVFLPGKTSEEFDKRYKELVDEEVEIKF